jgi:rubrerythrin
MDPYEFNTYKDRFDAVWRRVMSGGTEDAQRPGAKPKAHDPSAAEAGRLRSFMDDEATDAQIYGLLARKFRGRTRQTLLCLSSEERCHLKKLRAKYFILTGRTYAPPAACPFARNVPETLRLKVMDEAESAKAYLDAADETGYAELAETYRALASDETRHSRMLSDIIETLF